MYKHNLGAQTIATLGDRLADENDGEPVDDFVLMKTTHTNKHTGEIDDGVVRDVLSLIEAQKEDEDTRLSQLQTDLDATSTASTNLSQIRINEIVESSVPNKKGRLVGLDRRRSVPPSSAPPPFVDPEVLTAQLQDKDDRISLLETQIAAQQAGYEAQRRLNQQMLEMMQRIYPNEMFPNGLLPRNIPRDSFLGIFRGLRSSEIPDENSEEHFVGTSEDWTIGKSIEISRGSSPSVYSEELSDELVVLGVSSEFRRKFPRDFRGKMNFRGVISENLFRRYVVGITLFQRHTDDFFPRQLALKRTTPALNTNGLDISGYSATVTAEGQNMPANDPIEPHVTVLTPGLIGTLNWLTPLLHSLLFKFLHYQ
uniref:Uncharacterized protein n=1 Tax=Brassica oleracea var. oleracea TaxID=109376 RepID=A0A0D3CQM2_BRAOL